MDKCPCGGGKNYCDCCEAIISGEKSATTAEMLMRARYSAYVKGEVDYIINSTHPDRRGDDDEKVIHNWSSNSDWHGLEIISTSGGGAKEKTGQVEFIAKYSQQGVKHEHHEMASFKKLKSKWYFHDAEIVPQETYVRETPKVGRNDACPCGSGKKYKKCCG